MISTDIVIYRDKADGKAVKKDTDYSIPAKRGSRKESYQILIGSERSANR